MYSETTSTKKVSVHTRCGVTKVAFDPTVWRIHVGVGTVGGFSSVDGGRRQILMLSIHMQLHIHWLNWKIAHLADGRHDGGVISLYQEKTPLKMTENIFTEISRNS